jgi:hypothetical protein
MGYVTDFERMTLTYSILVGLCVCCQGMEPTTADSDMDCGSADDEVRANAWRTGPIQQMARESLEDDLELPFKKRSMELEMKREEISIEERKLVHCSNLLRVMELANMDDDTKMQAKNHITKLLFSSSYPKTDKALNSKEYEDRHSDAWLAIEKEINANEKELARNTAAHEKMLKKESVSVQAMKETLQAYKFSTVARNKIIYELQRQAMRDIDFRVLSHRQQRT